MAINKNHEFEDLDNMKCSIVERNASIQRVEFLKNLLEYNQYKVVVVSSPPPKAVPAKKSAPGSEMASIESTAPIESNEPAPETFTIGVTDVMFNPTNAIFGRQLKTPAGHIVTLAYWEQKESISQDELPYYIKSR